ncbi:hypothetical protein HBE96_05870 [Clostridium sp. P21]|uniref:Uncharacterized protein n=1 Tax=Clostridium muellerianum TaxID=2716538 RepID=A0A7Y0HLR6_9CLOT|nr:hypothetical protein [Clostridium muellerianum]NMM62219.1 hypothetical protein [Clostridium muellerianum]
MLILNLLFYMVYWKYFICDFKTGGRRKREYKLYVYGLRGIFYNRIFIITIVNKQDIIQGLTEKLDIGVEDMKENIKLEIMLGRILFMKYLVEYMLILKKLNLKETKITIIHFK